MEIQGHLDFIPKKVENKGGLKCKSNIRSTP